MSLLTAEEVTNLYLYGTKTVPANLASDSLIRPAGLTTTARVDVNEYMNAAMGPGRFASPAFFEVIKQFFSPTSSGLAAGTYLKWDLFVAFGLDGDIANRTVSIQQSQYNDNCDDYLSRAYIWETTAFQIDPRAVFVVEPNGNRYIKDFGIIPYSGNNNTENFDLKSSSLSSMLVNFALGPAIDPSGIGREVVISFDGIDGGRILQPQFTYDDYLNAASTAVQPTFLPIALGNLALSASEFTNRLFQSGSTRFLDGNSKPILYGTEGGEGLSAESVDLSPLFSTHGISSANGVRLIGGGGNDNLS